MIVPARFRVTGAVFPDHDYEGKVLIRKKEGYRTPDFCDQTLDIKLETHPNGSLVHPIDETHLDKYSRIILGKMKGKFSLRKPYENPSYHHRMFLGDTMLSWAMEEPFLIYKNTISVRPDEWDEDTIGGPLSHISYGRMTGKFLHQS